MSIKLHILSVVVIVFFSSHSIGQENRHTKNVVYYELGGISFAPFSINYERLIGEGERVQLSIGIGAAVTNYISKPSTIEIKGYQLLFPLQANLLIGKKNHKIEIGYGMPFAIEKEEFGISSGLYVLRLGYRYQTYQKGLFFRASVNPAILAIVPAIMGSLAIGYNF